MIFITVIALLIALASCAASKAPPKLAMPPPEVMRPVTHQGSRIAADADAARDGANHYIFSAQSTAEGIATVRHLVGRMKNAVILMQRHPSASNAEAARIAIAALTGWLEMHQNPASPEKP